MESFFVIAGIVVLVFFIYILSSYRRQKTDLDYANNRISKNNSEHRKAIKEKESEIIRLRAKIIEKDGLLSDNSIILKEKVNEIVRLQAEINRKDHVLDQKEALHHDIINISENTTLKIASLIADYLTLQYDLSAEFLENKKHPANTEALRIRELRKETKEVIEQFKSINYKYDALLSTFPQLEFYAENIEDILDLSRVSSLGELIKDHDPIKEYIPKEEYDSLSENERNQLALDQYIKGKKTNWQIGRDYEMYIGHKYRELGWEVRQYGIEKKLEDLGRDVVAENSDMISIIQCKYWSIKKQIHENHVMQLFGTTVFYKLKEHPQKKVNPILVTNTTLSETAKLIADYLGIEIMERIELGEFPRVKCNLNLDEFGLPTRIYHLPMDQQYDRTKITKKGECYVYTVQEAVSRGFRRAWRWRGEP